MALKVQTKVLAQGEVSKREAVVKAGATDVAMQQHQEEQKQETIKVIQAAVGPILFKKVRRSQDC